MAKQLSNEEGVRLAESINKLAGWLAARDLYEPTPSALENVGYEEADVVILFGGSPLAGADVMVSAMRESIARTSMVSGGRGHSTPHLIDSINREHPGLVSGDATEADALLAYMDHRGDELPHVVERASTNCGNNVEFSVRTLREAGIDPDTLVIIQDPVFMRRMKATFELQEPTINVVALPAYDVRVKWVEGIGLVFEQPTPHGMWPLDRYLEELSGEVPRLFDDESGYGPHGKGFINFVRVPPEILDDHRRLEDYLGGHRQADPSFADPTDYH